MTKGLVDIADIFTTISAGIKECTQQKDIEALTKLIQMLESFKNPKDFAMHVGKDILINGVNIYN